MKIKKIVSQNRRDFFAIFVCESCDSEEELGGYDDENYHNNVIPNIPCKSCHKKGVDINEDYRPLSTKYPEGMQV